MTGGIRIKALLQFAVMAFGCSLLSQVAQGESFDKPIRKVVVEVGQSKHFSPNDDRDFSLECFYYPAFMVKQLWAKDWKGTVMVTAISSPPDQLPPCRITINDPGESGEDGWVFIGAKGPLLFWEAPDGLNGGEDFRVVDLRTGKKIFEDTALIWNRRAIQPFGFASAPDGKMLIRYRRVVHRFRSAPATVSRDRRGGYFPTLACRLKKLARSLPLPIRSKLNYYRSL